MKKRLAILLAMTMMFSAAAAVAEESSTDTAETAETEVTLPFEDGEWLSVESMNAEVYLPAGWTLTESAEDSFTAAGADATSTLTVTVAAFDSTDLTTYMDAMGETYETVALTDRDAAVVTTDESVTVTFLYDEATLVTMVFTPATEGGIADNATAIAETFHIDSADETAAAETTAE